MAISLSQIFLKNEIVIPIIQRDYAQGRKSPKINKLRNDFLDEIFSTLDGEDKALELDFIYGFTRNSEGSLPAFIPLDGQQRLTTLFLLHWYAAVKDKSIDEARPYLIRFTYETRHSSRVFCEKLVEFNLDDFDALPSKIVQNEPWFFNHWINDPTISSMLVMLDSIHGKVEEYNLQDTNLWSILTEQNRIGFYLLEMEKLGLPDELYIKMNSRGKELTDFEYFKSRFAEILPNPELKSEFKNKVDQVWSDLFWDVFKNEAYFDLAKLVDDGFLRYFHFIKDLLISKNEFSVGHVRDEFEIITRVFQNVDNVRFLFDSLDLLSAELKDGKNPFKDWFYIHEADYTESKVRLFFQNPQINLFSKCAKNYDPSERVNPFSLGEQILLYACILQLKHKKSEFAVRLRKLRNLISKSEDTLRKDNFNTLIKGAESLVLNGTVDELSKFNARQIKEEQQKEEFINVKPGFRCAIYRLEDHDLLRGGLALIDFDDQIAAKANSFHYLFHHKCDFQLISKALLTMGDYTQNQSTRTRFGTNSASVWRELFYPSDRRSGFERTKTTTNALLDKIALENNISLDTIIIQYLTQFENNKALPRDWRYYFIKYDSFNKIAYQKFEKGYYLFMNGKNKYNFIMMRQTNLRGFSFSPFLYELHGRHKDVTSLDNYEAPLVLTKNGVSLKIYNRHEGFEVVSFDNVESRDLVAKIIAKNLINHEGMLIIKQNSEDFDVEDRIEKGDLLIKSIMNHG